MIPELKPFAGFSPICWVVLAHIEHCAPVFSMTESWIKITKTNINRYFFIQRKDTANPFLVLNF